ncbi:MAG: hypothetical protein JWQ44_2911 [Chthoniobacter sp.]|nr:hypothetical protein [Chthoniobacter sp.]
MAFAYITEYRRQPLDGVERLIPAGLEPSLTVQKLAIGAGSVQSAAFQANTTFVCINVDAPCSVAFGANPTATAAMTRIPLDGTQFFGVIPGDKVAVITNT